MTSSRKSEGAQLWVFVALLTLCSVVFGYVVLPRFAPAVRRTSTWVGRPAAEFVLPVIHGGEPGARVRLTDLKGRIVILDFWASWCLPCRDQAAVLRRVLAKVSTDDVVVLGINTADDSERGAAFARREELPYASVYDEGEVAAAYGASALPTLVLVDREGVIRNYEPSTVGLSAILTMLEAAGAKLR